MGTETAEYRRQSKQRIRVVSAFVVLLAALATAALASSAASAQDQSSDSSEAGTVSDAPASDVSASEISISTVTGVDATGDNVEVSIRRESYLESAPEVTVIEAGAEVEQVTVATASELRRPAEIMFVIDVANRSMVGGALGTIAGAIAAETEQLPAEVRFGLVTAGDQATLRTRLSADVDRFQADLQGLAADQGAAIHDAVNIAGKSFSDASGVTRSIIVLSSGLDTASLKDLAAAEASVVQSGAQIIWIPNGVDDLNMARLVERSGGTTVSLDGMSLDGAAFTDPEQARTVIESTMAIAVNRLLVSFPSEAASGTRVDVAMTIDDQAHSFSYPAGVNTVTGLQLAPNPAVITVEDGFFDKPSVLYGSIALAFVAIVTAVWALGSMFAGGETSLDKVLARYSDRDRSLEDDDVQEMLVQTALVRRAVDMTETFADRRGFLTRMEDLLERANLPFRAGEGLFFLAIIVILVSGLVAVLSGSLIVTLLVGILSVIAGFAVVQFKAGRRLKRFEAQLPDALQLLAGTLRAGYSLPQGLDAVSTEISDPMGQELRRAITETQLGREIEDALAGIAERLDSADFAWAVMAIGIQREVGGNLSELLMTVSETMIQRERLHREVAALTAEGRVSAGILSLLPPGLGVVMWVMNPDYLGVLFSRTIGLVLLGLAVVSSLAGLAWMKKVITIDV